MKSILYFFLFVIATQVSAQSDTIYYESGQVMAVRRMKDGKQHGKLKIWNESGQISGVEIWKKGKEVRSTRYFENGKKRTFERYRRFKVKMKGWYSNGKIWYTSVSKYSRSIEKDFDSTGILVHKRIEKKGSSLSCAIPEKSEISDSLMYKDGRCSAPWGAVYWRNGAWIDEKGRDLSRNYSCIQTDYFANGQKKKERVWDKEQLKYFVREWNEQGVLVSERFE